MGSSDDGLVCGQIKRTDKDVLQLEARSSSSRNKCIPDNLGERELCIPSILSDRQLPSKGLERSNRLSSNSTEMAGPTLVPNAIEHVDTSADTASADGDTADIPGGAAAPAAHQPAADAGGMARVRQNKQDQGFSPESAELFTKRWRGGTRNAYNASWNVWANWCSERDHNPMQAPVATIAQFLTDQHKNDKAYSTINSYRSTISGIHPLVGGGPVGQHPDIKGVMAGIYNENPPQAKYAETWDVDRVLSHMKTWGDNETMHIRDLTVKLTMLIAITTACRAAEIQCLDKTRMTDKGTTIVCNLTRPTKVTKTGQALTHLTL